MSPEDGEFFSIVPDVLRTELLGEKFEKFYVWTKWKEALKLRKIDIVEEIIGYRSVLMKDPETGDPLPYGQLGKIMFRLTRHKNSEKKLPALKQ